MGEISTNFLSEDDLKIKELQDEVAELEKVPFSERNAGDIIELKQKKSQLKDLKNNRGLYDPETGEFISGNKDMTIKSKGGRVQKFNDAVDQFQVAYEKTDVGKLEKKRDELYFRYKAFTEDFMLPNWDTAFTPSMKVKYVDSNGNEFKTIDQGPGERDLKAIVTYEDVENPGETKDYEVDLSTQRQRVKFVGGKTGSQRNAATLGFFGEGHSDEWNDKMRERQDVLLAEYMAVNRILSLNIDPGQVEDVSFVGSISEGLSSAFGESPKTESALADKAINSLEQIGFSVTDEQKNKLDKDIGQKIGSSIGGSIPATLEIGFNIMLGNKALGIAKIGKAIEVLSKGNKTAKFVMEMMAESIVQSNAFANAGESGIAGAGEGVGQFVAGALLKRFGVNNKLINYGARLISGAATETVAEFSGQFVDEMSKNGYDMELAAEKTFGKTPDELIEKVAITYFTGLALGLPGAGQESRAFLEEAYKEISNSDSTSPIVEHAKQFNIDKEFSEEDQTRLDEINEKVSSDQELSEDETVEKSVLEVRKDITESPTESDNSAPIVSKNGGDTEYKFKEGESEGFASEEEVIQKLDEESFVNKVKSGEIELDLNNPSEEVEKKIEEKFPASESDTGLNIEETTPEVAPVEGEVAEEVTTTTPEVTEQVAEEVTTTSPEVTEQVAEEVDTTTDEKIETDETIEEDAKTEDKTLQTEESLTQLSEDVANVSEGVAPFSTKKVFDSTINLAENITEETGLKGAELITELKNRLSEKIGENFDPEDIDAISGEVTEAVKDIELKVESTPAASPESTIKEKSKSLADSVRKLKAPIDLSNLSSSPKPIFDAAWNTAIEAAAITLETGGSVAQAISDGIKAIKENDWYKSLSKDGKSKVDNALESSILEKESQFNLSKKESDLKEKKESKDGEKTSKDGSGYKERSFPKQIDSDVNISNEIKDGLSKDGRNYIPVTNKLTVSEANAIIDKKGIDLATKDVLNLKNDMTPRVRVAMSLELIKKLNEKGTKEAVLSATEIADSVSEYATQLGQAIQTFSLWNQITADGMISAYEKNQSDYKRKLKDQNKKLYNAAKSGYKSGNKKAGKEAAEKVFQKKSDKTKKIKAFNLTKDQISKGKKDSLDRLKKALKGGSLTSGGINVEALEALTDYGFYIFADGVRNFKSWAKRMVEDTGVKDKAVLESIWMNQKQNNGKTLNDLSKESNIEEVVSDFFTESSDSNALSKKIQEAFNLDKKMSDELAKELVSEFERIVIKNRKAEIKSKSPVLTTRKVSKAINEISNSDGLTDLEIEEKIEEAFGVKNLTDDQVKTIKDLGKERSSRPEGFLQDEITREMLSAFAKFEGIPKKDILWSLWYSGVLSGYETQLLNVGANSINIGMESFVSLIEQSLVNKDPAAFGQAMSGLMKGMKDGSNEFMQVITSGYSPSKISQKLEVKDTLENVDFWGGKFNPYNYYKFVGRLMTAVDSASYMAAYGMRKQEAARELYRKEGLRGDDLRNKVTEVTSNDKEAYNEAFDQATQEINDLSIRENLSSSQKRRLTRIRANEILNKKLPEEVRLESEKFAAFATYNYDPKGILGVIAKTLSGLGEKKGLGLFKLIVPFTRVVANVLNQQIDYTPYGFLRAMGLNAGRGMKESTTAKDSRERNRQIIKASIGLISAWAIMRLAESYSDDDDPWFDVSGKGPSNYNKRNQLYSQGWKPYSVKVGDRWVNYQYSPIGLWFSLVGNWRDAEKYEGLSEAENSARLSYAVQASASGVFDMSFLTGLGSFFDALSTVGDPEKTKEKLLKTLGKTGSSFLVPNAIKQVDNIYDPTVYDKTSVYAAVLSEIPIVKRYSGLRPKLNSFGQPIEKQGNRFTTKVVDDPVWKFMAKNSLFAPGLSPNTKMLDGEVMTEDEFYDYAKESGQIAYKSINDLMSESELEFEALDNIGKKKIISDIFRDARMQGKIIVYDNYRK